MHSSPFSFQLMPLNMHLLRPILFGTTPRCIAPPSTTTLPPPLSPSDLVFLVSFPHVIEAVERRDVPAGVAVLITTELLRNGTTELEDMRCDEWIARDGVRLQRFCLTPEITRVTLLSPRVIPFIPVSELELRQYDGFVPFLEMDFRYLYKRNYEAELVAVISKAVVIDSIGDILSARKGSMFRMVYEDHALRELAAELGVYSIPRSGRFTWMYRGVAHFTVYSIQLYLTCESVFPCDQYSF